MFINFKLVNWWCQWPPSHLMTSTRCHLYEPYKSCAYISSCMSHWLDYYIKCRLWLRIWLPVVTIRYNLPNVETPGHVRWRFTSAYMFSVTTRKCSQVVRDMDSQWTIAKFTPSFLRPSCWNLSKVLALDKVDYHSGRWDLEIQCKSFYYIARIFGVSPTFVGDKMCGLFKR